MKKIENEFVNALLWGLVVVLNVAMAIPSSIVGFVWYGVQLKKAGIKHAFKWSMYIVGTCLELVKDEIIESARGDLFNEWIECFDEDYLEDARMVGEDFAEEIKDAGDWPEAS